MKKPNTANTNDVSKLVTCVSGILANCTFCDSLLTLRGLSLLDVALTSLKNIIESNQLDYPYLDVLDFEVSCFREKKIPYIEYSSGDMKFVTHEEALKEDTLISVENQQKSKLSEVRSYKEGNLAIGQIYIKGHEFYSTRLAIEHSLKSTTQRWYNQIGYIKELLNSKKGVL